MNCLRKEKNMTETKRKSKENPKKEAIVASLKAKLDKAVALFLTEYRGLTHQQLESLRKILKEVDAEYVIAKNTLLGISIDQSRKKNDLQEMKKELVNPTATLFAYGDAFAAVKQLADFARSFSRPKVKIGFLQGSIMDGQAFDRIASLPSHEVLLAILVYRLKSPIYGLHYALNWNMQKLVAVLDNIKDSKH